MELSKKNEEIKICCDENCARPVSNTGRVATKNNYSCCIDYLKIRVAGTYSIEDEFVINLFKLLYLNRTEYDMIPNKQYSIFFQYDEETFVLGGNKDSRLKDGNDAWYLELKGQGCRMLEQRFMLNDIETPRGWYELFEYIYRTNISGICDIKIKRIDATLDDYTGKITQEEIERKYVNHFWTSRSRSLKLDKSIDFSDLKNHIKYYKDKGWTLTHGGHSSRQLCIYNKKAERKARGYDAFVDSWMRFESRYFDENADWAFLKILNGLKDNKFNEVVCSLIGGIIEFKEDSECDRSQMYRVKTWSKWEELLNNVSAIKYVSQKKIEEDITLNKKKIWLIDSPYKILCMAFMSDPDNFWNFLSFMMKKAIKRMKKIDYKRVNYHRNEIGLDMKQIYELDELVETFFDLKKANFGDLPLYMQKYFSMQYNEEDEEKFEENKKKQYKEMFNFDELLKDIKEAGKRLSAKV